jgi:hypothetical protein
MYQLRKKIYGLFTCDHCRGKETFIIMLSFVLCFALLPEKAHATCSVWCDGGGAFATCCTTQQEAANVLSSSPPMGLCNVQVTVGRINDYGGVISFQQCDPNGNPFWSSGIYFYVPTDPCPPGSDTCCGDPTCGSGSGSVGGGGGGCTGGGCCPTPPPPPPPPDPSGWLSLPPPANCCEQ